MNDQKFPYEIHQVISPNNELVWVERGINPDDIFKDKRRSDWPFSSLIADIICDRIAEGESLTAICKSPGFPSYNIVSRWRAENEIFSKSLKFAYEDRAEFYFDKVISIVNSNELDDNFLSAKLKIEAFKWASMIDRPKSKVLRSIYNLLVL